MESGEDRQGRKLFFKFLFYVSGVLPACMLCTTFGSGVRGGQKGALGPLGLELWMVGSCQADAAS